MRKILILITAFFIILNSCVDKKKKIEPKQVKLDFNLEKIVIVNLNEVCVTYLKMKITNPSSYTVVLQDNSLAEYLKRITKTKKKGFYLKNTKNDSILPLGMDNYHFIEIKPNSSNYYFIGAKDLKHSFQAKDSLLLKKILSNYVIEYNGSKFDLNDIKKNKYIGKNNFDKFIKEKSNYITYKDTISLKIPLTNLKLKYLDKNPIYREEWDKL